NDPSTRNLITIYNMLGIMVDTKTFAGNQTQIHLELPPGTYILKVNTSTQQYIKKIIKNR
ncbi:MAG: Secretion system C-terminal sorting domain, partial [Bacteroidota bacterium]